MMILMSFLAVCKNRQTWLRVKSSMIENIIRNRLLVFILSFPRVSDEFGLCAVCGAGGSPGQCVYMLVTKFLLWKEVGRERQAGVT